MPIRGDRIREIRERRGMSQTELGTRCGIGEKGIWRYENGQGDPSADILARIARELDSSADYLLGLSDRPQGNLHDQLRDDEYALLTAYNNGNSKALFEIITAQLKKLGNGE